MKDFATWMGQYQTEWRRGRISTDEHGEQNGHTHSWIVPPAYWEEGLWPGVRSRSTNSLPHYLRANNVKEHPGVRNLKSSWIACANLYFPFRETAQSKSLIAGFLQSAVSDQIRTVDEVELEYAEKGPLRPSALLGEIGGSRGASQTSPDVAFLVNGGEGIVLTESKLTEHSFYRCSARTRKDSPNRPANPDPDRCKNARVVATNPESICHQVVWGRKYWDRLRGAIRRCCGGKAQRVPRRVRGVPVVPTAGARRGVHPEVSFSVFGCVLRRAERRPCQFATQHRHRHLPRRVGSPVQGEIAVQSVDAPSLGSVGAGPRPHGALGGVGIVDRQPVRLRVVRA